MMHKKALISVLALAIGSMTIESMDHAPKSNNPLPNDHVHPSRRKNIITFKRANSPLSEDEPAHKKVKQLGTDAAHHRELAELSKKMREETRRVERLRRKNHNKQNTLNHLRADLDAARSREEIAYDEYKTLDQSHEILEKENASLNAQVTKMRKELAVFNNTNRSQYPWEFVRE